MVFTMQWHNVVLGLSGKVRRGWKLAVSLYLSWVVGAIANRTWLKFFKHFLNQFLLFKKMLCG